MLSNIWYNLELTAVQNVFKVRMIEEGTDGKSKIDEAELLLRGEDLYHKSGSVALTTD